MERKSNDKKRKEPQHVDEIPLRDLEIDLKNEKDKKKSQNTSQSEENK
ncbi:hypothetical protein [Gracilibacillus dipsosauri]